jgi:hypothetical protein
VPESDSAKKRVIRAAVKIGFIKDIFLRGQGLTPMVSKGMPELQPVENQ